MRTKRCSLKATLQKKSWMSSFFKSKFTRSELANYMSSLDEQFTFPNPIAKVASKLSKAAHDDSPSSARSSASSFKSVSEPSTPIVDPELLLLSLTIKGNNFEYNGKINEKGEVYFTMFFVDEQV